MSNKKHINIMSSSDYRLVKFLPVTLINLHDVLGDIYEIDFYFAYKKDDIEPSQLDFLKDYANNLDINFYLISVDEKWLSEVQKYGGGYPEECYYYMFANRILPSTIDRILYMDAADILILDDIKDFYFCNFRDKAFCITSALTESTMTSFKSWEIKESNRHAFERFSKSKFGLFNSGFIMVNVERLRKLNNRPEDFVDFANKWHDTIKDNYCYCGDQCFISAYFLTEIQSTYYPKTHGFSIIKDIREVSNTNNSENLKAIHFVSLLNNLKPWHLSENLLTKIKPFEYVLYGNVIWNAFTTEATNLFLLWWKYCKNTPFYNDIKNSVDDLRLINGLIAQIGVGVKSVRKYDDKKSN